MPAPAVTVEIEGLRFLAQQLENLEAKAQRKVLRGAVRKAARPVMKEMRAKVPVDEGETKRAIAQSVKVKRSIAHVDIGIRRKAKGRPGSRVHFIEFGTVHQPAQPFMRPALDTKKNEAVKRLGEALKEEIDKVTAKARVQ